MTTNKISFISKMFVVMIAYLCINLVFNFNLLDFSYLIMLIGCFIKFIIIRKHQVEEWQSFFFII